MVSRAYLGVNGGQVLRWIYVSRSQGPVIAACAPEYILKRESDIGWHIRAHEPCPSGLFGFLMFHFWPSGVTFRRDCPF